MAYNFDPATVVSLFLTFLQRNFGYPDCTVIDDGKWHRFRTAQDHGGEKSGAYFVSSDDWPHGYAKDWRTGAELTWTFPRDSLDSFAREGFTEKEYKALLEKCRQHQKKLMENLALEQANASIRARDMYANLSPAPEDHPYLVKKHVRALGGLHYYKQIGSLAVPLRNISGDVVSIQWIDKDGGKKFFAGAATKGVFFTIAMDTLKPDMPILLGEGYATMATVYDLTGYPCIAAMNCGNLYAVAEALKTKYPQNKIIITADNDTKTQGNPGLSHAQETCKKLSLAGTVYPKFKRGDSGSDWNDFFACYGENKTREILQREIYLLCLPPDRQKVMTQVEQINAEVLRSKEFAPLKWAVEGFLPAGLSILAGGPKVGKSILSLHLSLAVAIGGCALGKINVEQGDVLYLALEDTQRRLQERIYGSNLPDDEDLSKLTLATRVPRQHEGGLEYMRWWLEAHEGARLVIIDTLQKFRKQLSGKGNIYAEDYEVVSELKKLADEFDVPILVIHHLKKAMSEDWLNEISGSQGIAGAADTLFALKRTRTENNGVLHRTGRDVEEKDFDMTLDGFAWILVGEQGLFTMPKWKRDIVQYLSEHSQVNPTELSQALNLSIGNAKMSLSRLVKDGTIKKVGFGTYTLA